ncbi:MAG: transposase [Verrucomicrobia bacterium]|nr:transposase [Verrucomicrobiota bacterium]
MARQLRVEYPGAIYHVTVRSNGQEVLFKTDGDRKYLLTRIGEVAERSQVRVYLFCLMSNHFHLVVETPRGNLNGFMHGILTGYGVYFNWVHNRHGHVTQGRYGARLVSGDEYLLKLSRYVHLNPVKVATLVDKPRAEKVAYLRAYQWSTYPSYIGQGPRNECVDYEPMLVLMGGGKQIRPGKYRAFVEGGLEATDDEFLGELEKSPRSIGNAKFREWVDGCYRELLEQRGVQEDVSFRHTGRNLDTELILNAVAKRVGIGREYLLERRRDATWRAVASWMLCKYGGRTQREVAVILGAKTGVAISCQLKKLRCRLAADVTLRSRVEKIEKALQRS